MTTGHTQDRAGLGGTHVDEHGRLEDGLAKDEAEEEERHLQRLRALVLGHGLPRLWVGRGGGA